MTTPATATAPTTEPIERGLQGTLLPEEYATKAPPHWGETYAPMAGHGKHGLCVWPCNAALGAFILRGDMYTKSAEWILIEDLKKNNAT